MQSKNHVNDAEHVIHLWEPLHFKITENYRYININPLFLFFSDLLYMIAFPILWIINSLASNLKIYGRENLRKIEGGKITISNHVHVMDCTMVGLANLPSKTYFLSLKSNFNIPIVNGIIRLLNAIPIPDDIENKKNFINAIDNLLKDGKTLHVYPEASLWPYYKDLRDFKSGAFRFAVENNMPIVPMVFKFREPTGFFKYLKRKPAISLYILEPIYPDKNLSTELASEKLKELTHTLMDETLKTD